MRFPEDDDLFIHTDLRIQLPDTSVARLFCFAGARVNRLPASRARDVDPTPRSMALQFGV